MSEKIIHVGLDVDDQNVHQPCFGNLSSFTIDDIDAIGMFTS
jgi:hypothetical protein